MSKFNITMRVKILLQLKTWVNSSCINLEGIEEVSNLMHLSKCSAIEPNNICAASGLAIESHRSTSCYQTISASLWIAYPFITIPVLILK